LKSLLLGSPLYSMFRERNTRVCLVYHSLLDPSPREITAAVLFECLKAAGANSEVPLRFPTCKGREQEGARALLPSAETVVLLNPLRKCADRKSSSRFLRPEDRRYI